MFAHYPLSFEYYGDDIENGKIQDVPDLTQNVEKDIHILRNIVQENLPFFYVCVKAADDTLPGSFPKYLPQYDCQKTRIIFRIFTFNLPFLWQLINFLNNFLSQRHRSVV